MGNNEKVTGKETEKEIEKLKPIFPLSPALNLNKEEMPEIDVYTEYLKSAFSNPQIHNIFLTGEYGIGKSSVIRAFENEYYGNNKKENEGFLYLSLGMYNRIAGDEGMNGDQPTISDDSQNALERRLLLQIYSRFHRKDFPKSSFKMIQENVNAP